MFRIWFLLLSLSGLLQAQDRLILFTQPGPLQEAFDAQTLEGLETFASEASLEILRVDAREGVPQGIHATPAVAYAGGGGISLYRGRLNSAQRIETFARTSRWIPQVAAPRHWEEAHVWRRDRLASVLRLKVSHPTGHPGRNLDAENFQREWREHVLSSLQSFKKEKDFSTSAADRLVYMDFYPWVAQDGTLYLSAALFSEFHCKEPVLFLKGSEALVGPWRRWPSLLKEATQRLEKTWLDNASSAILGDGLAPLSSQTPSITWKDLGVEATEKEAEPVLLSIAPEQTLVSRQEGPPPVLFQFPSPLDGYRGTFSKVNSHLTFGSEGWVGSKGKVGVDMSSVTMGEDDLDKELLEPGMLGAKDHPEASYDYVITAWSGGDPREGKAGQAVLSGTFSFKGKSTEREVVADFKTLPAQAGGGWLWMQADLPLDIRPYGVEEADGPAPARHTVKVVVNLILEMKSGAE